MNETAIVLGIGIVGIILFALRFGPYLIGRFIGNLLTDIINAEITAALEELEGPTETPYLDAKRNHCAAEGAEWFVLTYLDSNNA